MGDGALRRYGVVANATVSSRVSLGEDDAIVLVSDGVSDVLAGDEACSLALGGGDGEAEENHARRWTLRDLEAWRGARTETAAGGGDIIALGGTAAGRLPGEERDGDDDASGGGGGGGGGGGDDASAAWRTPTEVGVLARLRLGAATAARAAMLMNSGDNVAVLVMTAKEPPPPLDVAPPTPPPPPAAATAEVETSTAAADDERALVALDAALRVRVGTTLAPRTCDVATTGQDAEDGGGGTGTCVAFNLRRVVALTSGPYPSSSVAHADDVDVARGEDELELGDGTEESGGGGGGGGWDELDGLTAGSALKFFSRVPANALTPGDGGGGGGERRATKPTTSVPGKEVAVVARFLETLGGVPLRRAGETGGYRGAGGRPFSRGHFGEVWRATAARAAASDAETDDATDDATAMRYVLKRILVERGEDVRLSGRREAHFGEAIRAATRSAEGRAHPGAGHVARYESTFEIRGGDGGDAAEDELWLVFRDEGDALSSLMYADGDDDDDDDGDGDDDEKVFSASSLRVVRPSRWWLDRRASPRGRRRLRELIRQTIAACALTHALGVGHRDVKPSNLLVSSSSGGGDGSPVDREETLRLADFGSAVDARSLRELYGDDGPTAAQQTPEYAPPESLFDGIPLHHGTSSSSVSTTAPGAARRGRRAAAASGPGDPDAADDVANDVAKVAAYDMWSVGVLSLEVLALGTPKVFASVGRRTRSEVERRLRGASAETKEIAVRLRAMLELCVFPPERGVAVMLSWECTEDALTRTIAARDPLGLGLPSAWALRLIRRLLSWDPGDRPSAEEALTHAFFRDDDSGDAIGRGYACAETGAEFEFRRECEEHCGRACD